MFLIGTIAGTYWAPPLAWCAAGLCGTLACAGLLARRRRRFAAVLMLAGFILGVGRMTMAVHAIPFVDTRYSVLMTGSIASDPIRNPGTGRVISKFDLEAVDGAPSSLSVRLYLRGEDDAALDRVALGQRLRLTGHIWANEPVTNPYEFDFPAYLHRNGMSAIATAKIEDVATLSEKHDIRTAIAGFRRVVAGRIDTLFPDSAPLVRALVLGDRSLISEELRQSMNATGTAHLIAISGMHVTVLAFALAWLLKRFMPARKAALAVVPLLLVYGVLIGFRASFVRALVMYAILCAAPLLGLPSDAVTRLSAALLLYLMMRPLDICDAGMVLSFSASAGLLLLMPPLQSLLGIVPIARRDRDRTKRHRWYRRALSFVMDLLCASLAAQLATLPAVIAWFGVQSVISLPFNLICVPLCMAGYVLAVGVLALSAVSLPLAMLLAHGPSLIFRLLLQVTRFSGSLPVTTVRIGRYPPLLVLIHCGLILAASELSRVRISLRRFLPLGLVGIACAASAIVWLKAWPFSVTFLDADQADCAVLRTRGHTYVFDTGDTYTPVGDYLAATCLKLDGVILSHPHQDHAGGLSDILDVLTPGAIYVPAGWFDVEEVAPVISEGIERARALGVPIVSLYAGRRIPLSADCALEVWSPDAGLRPDTVNDMSLLTLVSSGGHSVLFTGDLTIEGEPEDVPECDVLKVAHHGADNATSYAFLAGAAPSIAVISVGENDYGHPGAYAMERIASAGATILRTDELGAITMRPDGDDWKIDTFLEAHDDVE